MTYTECYLEALREQIIRDRRVLMEDPVFHVPSRQFFEDRIAACREALRRAEETV